MKSMFAALALAVTATLSHATVVYDTLGQPQQYLADRGWFFGDPNNQGVNFVTADAIVPSGSGFLQSITLPLDFRPAAEFGVQINVHTDAGGTPGAVVSHAHLAPGALVAIYTVTFNPAYWLNQGQTYWVSLSADVANPATLAVWDLNALGITGAHAFTGAAWQQPGEQLVYGNELKGALQVSVSAVPDAPTPLLLGAGLLGVLGVMKKRARTRVGA